MDFNQAQEFSALLQEHFKECEKEAKLKPFAKAALASKPERVDFVPYAKEEAQRWLRDSVNPLTDQVKGFEVLRLVHASDMHKSC